MFEDIDPISALGVVLNATLLLVLAMTLRGQMRARQVTAAQIDRLRAALKASRPRGGLDPDPGAGRRRGASVRTARRTGRPSR
jgi:hypothetical protein